MSTIINSIIAPPSGTSAWRGESAFLRPYKGSTKSVYQRYLHRFARWVQAHVVVGEWPLCPSYLTNEIIIEYYQCLLAEVATKTADAYMSPILRWLKLLAERDELPDGVRLVKLERHLEGLRQEQPDEGVDVMQLDADRQRMPDIVAYFDELPLPKFRDSRLTLLRHRSLFHLLISTGARISEALSIKKEAVANGQRQVGIIGKGGKPRFLHLDDEAVAAIGAYMAERGADDNPYLFAPHSRNANEGAISTVAVHYVIKEAVQALGLPSQLSAHDFRHYRATQLLRAGMPLEVLQEFLGHSNPLITRQIYAPVLGAATVSQWLEKVS